MSQVPSNVDQQLQQLAGANQALSSAAATNLQKLQQEIEKTKIGNDFNIQQAQIKGQKDIALLQSKTTLAAQQMQNESFQQSNASKERINEAGIASNEKIQRQRNQERENDRQLSLNLQLIQEKKDKAKNEFLSAGFEKQKGILARAAQNDADQIETEAQIQSLEFAKNVAAGARQGITGQTIDRAKDFAVKQNEQEQLSAKNTADAFTVNFNAEGTDKMPTYVELIQAVDKEFIADRNSIRNALPESSFRILADSLGTKIAKLLGLENEGETSSFLQLDKIDGVTPFALLGAKQFSLSYAERLASQFSREGEGINDDLVGALQKMMFSGMVLGQAEKGRNQDGEVMSELRQKYAEHSNDVKEIIGDQQLAGLITGLSSLQNLGRDAALMKGLRNKRDRERVRDISDGLGGLATSFETMQKAGMIKIRRIADSIPMLVEKTWDVLLKTRSTGGNLRMEDVAAVAEEMNLTDQQVSQLLESSLSQARLLGDNEVDGSKFDFDFLDPTDLKSHLNTARLQRRAQIGRGARLNTESEFLTGQSRFKGDLAGSQVGISSIEQLLGGNP